MKRGKDEEKTMGPMFPRLHVNDTGKGGPRAPPRNKMALYEQLSIPSQRFNGGVLPFNPNSAVNSLPPSSSTMRTMNERGTFFPLQQTSSVRPSNSDFNNQLVQQEQKKRQEEDDFRVPIFDQQSGANQNRSGNNQNRENEGITPLGAAFSGRLANIQNARQNTKIQKENSLEFAKSVSNQSSRPNNKVPFRETNESSSFGHRNASNNSSRLHSNGNLRDHRVDSQADNSLWGDSVLNEAIRAIDYGNTSTPVRDVQQEVLRSPNDPTNGDDVSETSMVDSICGVDISPDDVVGIIGLKHFWKARRAIVNQQRVFAVQVFELHRLIKVQRLIAGSPQLLVEDDTYLAKPPKVSPVKKIPQYVLKPTQNVSKHKDDCEKPNDDTEFSAENAVGKASLCSVQNGSPTANCRPFARNPLPPSDPKMGSWSFNQPPGHQWLIPVMSLSEGLIYKPYPGHGFMSPLYGGCGPAGSTPMIGHNFANYGVPPSGHHYEGVHPFAPLASHGYFPPYGLSMVNPSISSSRGEQTNLQHQSSSNVPIEKNGTNQQHQSSSNVPIEKNGAAVPNVVKLHASKDSEVQVSNHYEGVHPFAPLASHGYFPPYGLSMVNPSISSSRGEQTNLQHQSSSNVPIEKNGAAVPNVVKLHASKDSEVQVSTASSRSNRTLGRNALPLFPTSPPAPAPVGTAEPTRVIRVIPHNARSATASVARIFQSIQEERKQYDSG